MIVDVPEFVKGNEKLQKAWVEKWEQLVTGSFDFSQSILLPHNHENFESKLDKVLKDQRAQDINELIAQCKFFKFNDSLAQEEYKKRVSIEGPPEKINRDVKDPKHMQKLDVLSGALNQVEAMKKHKMKQRVQSNCLFLSQATRPFPGSHRIFRDARGRQNFDRRIHQGSLIE